MRRLFKARLILHRKITWLLLFSVFSLAMASWLIYVSKKNIDKTNLGIDRTYEIITGLTQLKALIAQEETRTLRNGPSHLPGSSPATRDQLDKLLSELQQLSIDNGENNEQITRLRQLLFQPTGDGTSDTTLSGASASSTSSASSPARTSGPSGPSGPYGTSGAPLSFQSVERTNELLAGLIPEERRRLAIRKQQNEEANRKTALSLLIARALGFLFIVIVLMQLNSDITRRRQVQEQLVRAIRDANEAKKMQEQFLANMSHEIRTPMNGIKGMTDLLLGTPLTDKQQELAGIIKSSAGHLLTIINDILDLSKIKAGKLNIESIPFDIREVIDNAAVIFEHRFSKKGISLQLDIDPAIPPSLTGDPHRLYQVIVNLLGNALKFTSQGTILVKATLRERGKRVSTKSGGADTRSEADARSGADTRSGADARDRTDTRNEAETRNGANTWSGADIRSGTDTRARDAGVPEDKLVIAFCISDTGIGIPEDHLPYIFDSFVQAGQDISRRYGGTGLGLTICKQLLHMQGGDISVISKMGEGSRFDFHLPYGYSKDATPATAASPSVSDYQDLLAGKRFLVAEDNEINQKLIDYVLSRAGGIVELAGNGKEAVQQLRNGKTFDIIIMDLQMPEMDGYAATLAIRNELHIHTPIIAMTATAMEGEKLQCIRSGMNEYMTKPFEFADLYGRIGKLLALT